MTGSAKDCEGFANYSRVPSVFYCMTGSAKDCEGFANYSRVPSVLYCITGSAKHGEGFANLYITTSESQVCFTIVYLLEFKKSKPLFCVYIVVINRLSLFWKTRVTDIIFKVIKQMHLNHI
jgi:hypothetical protein